MNASTTIDKNILDLKLERTNLVMFLEESRKKKEFTDVQLQIGDKLFDAHRNVLSFESPVLKAMFSDQWSTTKVCPISDEYVDPSIVEDLLHFLYTGSIQLTPDNVHSVCVAAHFLQIPSLLEPSVKHLSRLVTIENVLSLFEFSVNCQLELLRFPCLRLIARNHEKIFQDPQTLQFSATIFNNLISGLKKQNRPGSILKENTFDCIVRWTEVNLSERLDELPGLLKNIPLEELPLKFLTKTVSKHRLVKESISCIQTVSTALANTPPERGDNLVILSTCGEKMACYDTETKVWKNLPDMLERRSFEYVVTVVNRKDIVVCGGTAYNYPNRETLDTVEMFEWASQTWKQLPKVPFPVTKVTCSIASLDGRLYITGKENPKEDIEVVCYSFETQQWRYVKPMNIPRLQAKLVEYDGYLYVLGGGTNTVEQYDPFFDEWTCIYDVPRDFEQRKFGHFIMHQNKLYGWDVGSLKEFDPETNYWTRHSESNSSGSIASADDRLLLAKTDTKWIYKYSFTTRKWTRFVEKCFVENCFLFAGPFY